MAARIGVACLKSDPAKTIKASDYDPDTHRGDVLCPVERCRCELQGVQASNRTINGELIAVEAFFRLPGNAEKSGRGHTSVCRYNVEKTVKKLVAASEEIKRLDKDAEPLLAAGRGQGAEFRLHVLMELLPFLPRRSGGGDPDATAGAGARTGTSYGRSGRLLPSYLRIAKAVLSLVSRVQERPELAKWVRLKYGSRTIPWEDYFFDFGEYATLHKHLASHGQHRRRPGRDRPVALAMEVAGGRITRTRFGHWQIRGVAAICPVETGDAFALRPVLYVGDESLARKIARERHVLVCGIPTLGGFREPDKPWLKPCADVSVDVINRGQVCRYSPMLKR